MKTLKIRVIGNTADAGVSRIAEWLSRKLSQPTGPFSVEIMTSCPNDQMMKCHARATRPCTLVVAVFTANPSEETASATTACDAGSRLCCGGKILILQPRNTLPRRLSLDGRVLSRVYTPEAPETEVLSAVLDSLGEIFTGVSMEKASSPINVGTV